MEVSTDEPGIQLYTGNFLDGTLQSKQSGTYGHRTGFCLETQHYPDSPNQKDFPSVVLNPGENYITKTSFKFTTK
jgi:aldose 1-epimerase